MGESRSRIWRCPRQQYRWGRCRCECNNIPVRAEDFIFPGLQALAIRAGSIRICALERRFQWDHNFFQWLCDESRRGTGFERHAPHWPAPRTGGLPLPACAGINQSSQLEQLSLFRGCRFPLLRFPHARNFFLAPLEEEPRQEPQGPKHRSPRAVFAIGIVIPVDSILKPCGCTFGLLLARLLQYCCLDTTVDWLHVHTTPRSVAPPLLL